MALRSGIWFLACLLCLLSAAPSLADDPFPRAAAAYLVKTGDQTVWSHQADRRLAPASLTKVMTALIVLERARLDEVVVVSAGAAAETGSRIHLRRGDRLFVGDLLAALLIKSANDAAHALAEHVGGSIEGFAALMNQRAAQLGMTNTHFRNPSGLDQPHHYTTAADLALLAEAALSVPAFRTLVGQEAMDIHTVGWGRTFHLKNSNRLLGVYDGLVGVKTGFTNGAGPCLIALAEREGEKVLLVLLNSPGRWQMAPAILDRAFEHTRLARNQVALVGDQADGSSGSEKPENF